MRFCKEILFILLVLLNGSYCYSQFGSFGSTDAFSMGLGNTYTAAAKNVLAIGKNPAMVCFPEENDFTINVLFPNYAATGPDNENMSCNFINSFKDGNISSITDKTDDNGYLFMDRHNRLFALTITGLRKYGTFGFAVSDYRSEFVYADPGLKALLNNDEPLSVSSAESMMKYSHQRVYSFTYSRDVHNVNSILHLITSGITFKYISGFSTLQADSTNIFSSFNNNVLRNDIDAVFYQAGATGSCSANSQYNQTGKGIAFDIGIALYTTYGLTLGFAITDIGFIDWENVSRKRIVLDTVITGPPMDRENLLSGAKDYETLSPNYNTGAPLTLRAGLVYSMNEGIENLPGEFDFAFDINIGLSSQASRRIIPRVSAGLSWQYKQYWPVLLTGLSNSNTEEINYSLGVGYSDSHIDAFISTLDIYSVFGGTPYKKSAALSIAWKLSYE